MKLNTLGIRAAFLAAIWLIAAPAGAVIKLELPISRVYETSKAVLVGTVAEVQPDTRLIEVHSVRAAKGTSPGPQLRIVVAAPAELIKQVAPAQPVVVFFTQSRAGGAGQAVIHLADTWLLAQGVPGSQDQVWRVVQVWEATKPGFPGRTAMLVRLIDEFKAGRNAILDKFERKLFAGGIRQRAKLNVQQPTWLLAADFNGDKQPDLLIGSASGTRLLLATERGYDDVTEQWGSWRAAGGYHAVGDVNGDGKLDLLLNDTLWINDGRKFTATKVRLDLPANVRPLAAALADVTGDGKPDALVLAADGELRVFENPGSLDKPWPPRLSKKLWKAPQSPTTAAFGDWGDTGKLHVLVVGETGVVRYPLDADSLVGSDLERLTGVNIAKNARYRNGLKNAQAVVLDADQNGRPDLFAVCDTGGLLLVNRGFGTFLLDEDAAGPFAVKGDYRPPFQLSPSTPWTAADLHGDGWDDLLVLTADGTLYEVDSKGTR